MLTPPAPAGGAENNSSPVEEFNVTELFWMLTVTLWQYGSTIPATGLSSHEPGAALVALPWMYAGGYSPWPTLIPPESVPELLVIRLFAICRLCPQACTKTPPPPCELFSTVNPSML